MILVKDVEKVTKEEHLREARKSLYFWKNNPENNEKHFRKQMNVPTKVKEEDTRSLLGV